MFEFVLMVVLANAIMLACLYILRHVIAIRAPVLFIAVGISIFYCILYPFLVSRVPYPKVLYLYALLIMVGAALLYIIETRFFSVEDISDNEVAGMPIGDTLAVVEGKWFSLDSIMGMVNRLSLKERIRAFPLIVKNSRLEQPGGDLTVDRYASAGVEAELTLDNVHVQEERKEPEEVVDTLALCASQVVATHLPGGYCTKEIVEVQDDLEELSADESRAEPGETESVRDIVQTGEAVTTVEDAAQSFEDISEDAEEIAEGVEDISEDVTEELALMDSHHEECIPPVSLYMLDILDEVVIGENSDKPGISRNSMTILDVDEVTAVEETITSSDRDYAEDGLVLQDHPGDLLEETENTEGDEEEHPAEASESEIYVQDALEDIDVEVVSADEAVDEPDAGDISEVITEEQWDFEGAAGDISGGETRDEQEWAGDSQISIMVAKAFDSLASGDSAGAVEGFFRVLKMEPPPKLAVMLCIEISSIYLAGGHKRQALAVLEMLEVVWGHALDSGDAQEVKIKIKRLRGEIL